MVAMNVRGTEVRIHPLMAVVAAAACVAGALDVFLIAAVAVLLHESAHALAAKAVGCKVYAIELTPFGGVMRIKQIQAHPQAETIVAAAGPVAGFIAAGICAMLLDIRPNMNVLLETFLRYNLALSAVNLLPALPLDGGRILYAALKCRLRADLAHRLCAAAGVFFGACMLALTALMLVNGEVQATMPLMAVFLMISAIRELRTTKQRRLAAILRRGEELRTNGFCPARLIAAQERMRARDALALIREHGYTVLYVVNDQCFVVGMLDESRLILAYARLGARATIGEILEFDRGTSL